MQEDDSVALTEEVLSRGGATGASGEVVNEADSLVLERDGGTATGDKDKPTGRRLGQVVIYESAG